MTGKRGFVTQPATIAKQKGVYRPSRHGNEKENLTIESLSKVPKPPERLDKNGADFWNEMLSDLIKINGLIAFTDLPNFELMAYNFQIIRICQKELENGLMVIDNNGNQKQSPFWNTFKEAEKVFIMLSREYGCTASARNRLNFESNEVKEDPLAQFGICL